MRMRQELIAEVIIITEITIILVAMATKHPIVSGFYGKEDFTAGCGFSNKCYQRCCVNLQVEGEVLRKRTITCEKTALRSFLINTR